MNLVGALTALLGEGRTHRAPVAGRARAPAPAGEAAGAVLRRGTAPEGALGPRAALAVVAVTGTATFVLEVAWFRSLRAAFQSTTDSFALMLIAVLVALALGARLAERLPASPKVVGGALLLSGCLALLATPAIERLDVWIDASAGWKGWVFRRFAATLGTLGVPMLPLGVALPLLVDRSGTPEQTARLYGTSTLASAIGALGASWLLLPAVGFAATAWLAGGALALAGLALAAPAVGRRGRSALAAVAVVALAVAVAGRSGIGRTRVQGQHLPERQRVLFADEGPDATVSVVEGAAPGAGPSGAPRPGAPRELVIDGFQTSGEGGEGHYMRWMGRLPMLFHPAPRRALVVCFGTGQTVDAVRDEGALAIDVAELSPATLRAAPLFRSNHDVLRDPRVRTVVMDGRAWLRRTDAVYDVVTLEPMAPHFAGSNALYSQEFYRLARARLAPGGVLAQWLPLHIVSAADAAAIVRTVQEVLPDTWVWIDPVDHTGIVLGRKAGADGSVGPADPWVGLARPGAGRDLAPAAIRAALLLDPAGSARLGAYGEVITDDNQWLAYGRGRQEMVDAGSGTAAQSATLALLRRLALGETL